jgi:hypothetical protein
MKFKNLILSAAICYTCATLTGKADVVVFDDYRPADTEFGGSETRRHWDPTFITQSSLGSGESLFLFVNFADDVAIRVTDPLLISSPENISGSARHVGVGRNRDATTSYEMILRTAVGDVSVSGSSGGSGLTFSDEIDYVGPNSYVDIYGFRLEMTNTTGIGPNWEIGTTDVFVRGRRVELVSRAVPEPTSSLPALLLLGWIAKRRRS